MSVAVSSYKDHKERRKHAECKALAMEIMGLSSKYDDKVSESVRQMAEKILAENKVYGVIYTRQMKQASLRDGQVPPVTHFERDRHPKVLAATTAWIKKESWADKAVLWLHGPEGCGKSSICYTLAEELDDMQQLAASYAFKHEDFPANQVDLLNKTFMANLIVDMCEVLKERFRPLVCEHVEQAEAADPDLCKSPLRKQLVKILVPVFKKLNRPSSDPSLVVVIDGIDNAELAARASLLDMIRYSITASLPIRYILASQRNDDLVKHLETGGRLSPHVHSLDVRESPDDNPDTPVAQTPTARSIGPWERVYMPYSGDKQSHQADVQRFDSRFPDDSHF